MSMALLQAASGPDLAAQLRGVLDGGLFVLQSALSLGAAEETVKKRVQRARTALAECMGEVAS